MVQIILFPILLIINTNFKSFQICSANVTQWAIIACLFYQSTNMVCNFTNLSMSRKCTTIYAKGYWGDQAFKKESERKVLEDNKTQKITEIGGKHRQVGRK